MPIAHIETAGTVYTADIQQSGGGAVRTLIDRVIEAGTNKTIWERDTAPMGWYGVWYPNGGAAGSPTYAPMDDSFLDFAATVEITGDKRNVDHMTGPLEEDWNSILPAPPGPFSLWDDWGYQSFLLIRESEWGDIHAWDITETFNQTPGFREISVVINGITYNGLMSPSVGGVTPIRYKFT